MKVDQTDWQTGVCKSAQKRSEEFYRFVMMTNVGGIVVLERQQVSHLKCVYICTHYVSLRMSRFLLL